MIVPLHRRDLWAMSEAKASSKAAWLLRPTGEELGRSLGRERSWVSAPHHSRQCVTQARDGRHSSSLQAWTNRLVSSLCSSGSVNPSWLRAAWIRGLTAQAVSWVRCLLLHSVCSLRIKLHPPPLKVSLRALANLGDSLIGRKEYLISKWYYWAYGRIPRVLWSWWQKCYCVKTQQVEAGLQGLPGDLDPLHSGSVITW